MQAFVEERSKHVVRGFAHRLGHATHTTRLPIYSQAMYRSAGVRPRARRGRLGFGGPEEVADTGLLGALDGHLHRLVELRIGAVDAGADPADVAGEIGDILAQGCHAGREQVDQELEILDPAEALGKEVAVHLLSNT